MGNNQGLWFRSPLPLPPSLFPLPAYTASDKLVKLKSFALIVGITTGPPCSVPPIRTAGPSASRLLRRKSGDSLKRKFLIDLEIFPFSIRNVPSRVRPVNRIVRGSTGRRYHRRVTRIPRGVDLIMSSTEVVPPSNLMEDGNPVGCLPCFCAQKRE